MFTVLFRNLRFVLFRIFFETLSSLKKLTTDHVQPSRSSYNWCDSRETCGNSALCHVAKGRIIKGLAAPSLYTAF